MGRHRTDVPPEGVPGSNPSAGDDNGRLQKMMAKMADAVMYPFGLGAPKPREGETDASTQLSLERTYLATQRTLQAWIRTTLSMISFGFTIGKLGQAMQEFVVRGVFSSHTVGVKGVAYFLVVLGTLGLLGATAQFWYSVRLLEAQGLRHRPSLEYVIAILLCMLGIFALSALILEL